MYKPNYIQLFKSKRLQEIADQFYKIYDSCELCPRKCGVNRNNDEEGICSSTNRVKISSVNPHFGEERPLVGTHGSGTIFFSNCNLLCLYCQNWDISHQGDGEEIGDEKLATIMIRLQKLGCHNINLVTPTHYLPNILQALVYATEQGLKIPLVFNTGGYDRLEIIKMLDGVIDIYMPDFKYSDGEISAKYSHGANDYPEIAKAVIKEMHRQVGILQTDKNNIAQRGLIIRHLVLPFDLAGTEEVFKFIAEEIDPGSYVNIMAQYHPCNQAHQYTELSRIPLKHEMQQAFLHAKNYKLSNLD